MFIFVSFQTDSCLHVRDAGVCLRSASRNSESVEDDECQNRLSEWALQNVLVDEHALH